MKFTILLIASVLSFSAVSPAPAHADFTARVVSVNEGDTITIMQHGRDHVIHLRDIDCPELKQPYGKQARHATAAFVGGREVVIRGLHRNRQGQTTAEILLQDGRNVGYELVKEGLAWVRPESGDGQALADLQQLARAAGKGLWSDPHAVAPWKWKVKKKVRQ